MAGRIIKPGQTKTSTFEGKAIRGLSLDAILFGKTADTAITQPGIDYDKVNLRINAYIGGKEYQIYVGKMKPLVMDSAYLQSTWSTVYPGSANYAALVTLVDASGVKETSVMPGRIDFHIPIILKGKDWLTVEVELKSDAVAATADETTSYLYLEAIEADNANMYAVPIIDVFNVDAAVDSFPVPAADNVMQISFINYDKTDILTASQVLSTVRIDSDRYSRNANYNQLIADRLEYFATVAEANDRDQSHMLFSGADLDECSVQLSLNASNVNASKNYVVRRRFVTNENVVKRAIERKGKHEAYRQRKFGLKMK